jgi:predicted membrane protein
MGARSGLNQIEPNMMQSYPIVHLLFALSFVPAFLFIWDGKSDKNILKGIKYTLLFIGSFLIGLFILDQLKLGLVFFTPILLFSFIMGTKRKKTNPKSTAI